MGRRTTSEGKALVDEYYQSGLTQKKFSDQKGISICTLQYWIRRNKQIDDGENNKAQHRFVEITVPQCESVAITFALGQMKMSFSGLPPCEWLYDFVTLFGNEK